MTDYKPLDLGPIRERAEECSHIEGLHEDWLNSQERSALDVPCLLAEVVRLRREMAVLHHGDFSCWVSDEEDCPTCQAAALDGWDPSKPLDWKPEEKA